jgi:hypothetical protein
MRILLVHARQPTGRRASVPHRDRLLFDANWHFWRAERQPAGRKEKLMGKFASAGELALRLIKALRESEGLFEAGVTPFAIATVPWVITPN